MRVVHIDRLAPGGADLEVHPRLTVLRGASPELRRRLSALLGALAGSGSLEETGVIDISGVRLALDAATVGELGIQPGVDPVVVDLATSRSTPLRPRDVSPSAAPVAPVAAGSDEETELRAQLRAVGAERTSLGAEMDQARAGLDSFSTASLQVCLGQVEALEGRRAAQRDDRRRGRRERDRRRSGSDPVAAALATRLDAAAVRVGELTDRRAAWVGRERELRAELERVRARIGVADRRAAPPLDRDAVERLEAVRDELHELVRPQGVLGGGRNRRRVTDLRAEEAVLLDRLGYDTYTAYVMGIPSEGVATDHPTDGQADEQGDPHPVADAHRERVERLEARLEALLADEPGELAVAEAEAELLGLLDEAAALVGTGPVGVQPGAGTVEARRLAVLLRSRRHEDREVTAPEDTEVDGTPGTGIEADIDIEAELDAARERLAAVEARVEAHEQATARVALLRERELELRDRERALLARIAAVATSGAADEAVPDPAVHDRRVSGQELPDRELPDREVSGQGASDVDPEAAEWAVVARLARQRSVSFVGALPMLVDGVPADPSARSAVLGRLDRMSDLVQVVVVSDDDAAAEWAAGLGDRGRCIEL
jgi:hypothetical protein